MFDRARIDSGKVRAVEFEWHTFTKIECRSSKYCSTVPRRKCWWTAAHPSRSLALWNSEPVLSMRAFRRPDDSPGSQIKSFTWKRS